MSEKAVPVIPKSKDSSLIQPPSTTTKTTTLKVESDEVVQKKKPERKQEYTDLINSLIQQQHQLSTPKNQ